MMLLALLPLAHAACPASQQDIDEAVDLAIDAWAKLDEGAFAQHRRDAMERVACASEVVLPAGAAGVHRLAAIGAFFEGDEAAATQAFRAARALEPGYSLPSAVAVDGSPLAALYAGATQAPAAVPLGVPDHAVVYVDGRRSTTRGEGVPAVLQVQGSDGAVAWSGWVDGGLPQAMRMAIPEAPPPPSEPDAAPPALPTEPATVPTANKRNPFVPLAIASGALAAGSYAAAVVARGRYDTQIADGDITAAQGSWDLNHGALFAAGGTGALAAGFTIAAVVR